MTDNKGILIVSNRFFADSYGGTEKLTNDVALSMKRIGYSVVCLATGYTGDTDFIVRKNKEDIIEWVISPSSYKLADQWKEKEFEQKEKIKKSWRHLNIHFSCIHIFHFSQIGLSFLDMNEFNNCKIIFTLTDYTTICPDYQLYKRHSNKICKGTVDPIECLVCTESLNAVSLYELKNRNIQYLNNRVKSLFVQTPAQARILIENGVIEEKIKYQHAHYLIPQTWGINNEKKTNGYIFGFIGRLSPEKGLKTIVQAFKELLSEYKHLIYLKILGAPDDEQYFKEVLELSIGIQEIQYIPPVPEWELVSFLNTIDCLLIPSCWMENHPVVLDYALALNIPVLCSGVESLTHLDDPFIGFVKDYYSTQAWSQSMKENIEAERSMKIEENRVNTWNEKFQSFISIVAEEYNQMF